MKHSKLFYAITCSLSLMAPTYTMDQHLKSVLSQAPALIVRSAVITACMWPVRHYAISPGIDTIMNPKDRPLAGILAKAACSLPINAAIITGLTRTNIIPQEPPSSSLGHTLAQMIITNTTGYAVNNGIYYLMQKDPINKTIVFKKICQISEMQPDDIATFARQLKAGTTATPWNPTDFKDSPITVTYQNNFPYRPNDDDLTVNTASIWFTQEGSVIAVKEKVPLNKKVRGGSLLYGRISIYTTPATLSPKSSSEFNTSMDLLAKVVYANHITLTGKNLQQ